MPVVELVNAEGEKTYREEADAARAEALGYRRVTPAETVQHLTQQSEEAHYTALPQAASAVVQGVTSGATLGLSALGARLASSDEENADNRKLLEHNAGKYTLGQIAGGLGTAVATGGISTGATAALGARLGGGLGARLAARASVEAAEGAIYGVGQGLSNLAISASPITKEAVAEELIKNGLYGAGIGALTGVVGAGGSELLSSASRGLDKRAAGIAVDSLVAEEEAAVKGAAKVADKPVSIGGLDEPTAELFSKKLENGFAEVEEAASNARAAHESPLTPKDLIYSARASRQLFQETAGLVDAKTIAPELAQMKKAQQELGKLFNGFNDGLDRPDILDAGALKMLSNKPELYEQAAKHLDDWRSAAVEVQKKAGLDGKISAAKFIQETPEQLSARLARADDAVGSFIDELPPAAQNKVNKAYEAALAEEDPAKLAKKVSKLEDLLEDHTSKLPAPYVRTTSAGKVEFQGAEATERMAASDPHRRIQAVAQGKVKPAVSAEMPAAIDEFNAVSKTMNDTWGLKPGAKIDQKAVQKFLALPPEKAVEAAKAFAGYVDALGAFTSKFDDGAAGLRHQAGSTQIQEALGLLKGSPAGIGAPQSTADMFAAIAGVPAEAVQVSGAADDMLKLWASSRLTGGKPVAPTPAGKEKLLSALLGHAKGIAAGAAEGAALSAITGQNPIHGAIAGAGLNGRGLAKKLLSVVKDSGSFARAAGAATSRLARATETLAKGGKASRYGAPTALALLNSYSFGDDAKQGKNLQEAYQHRLDELAAIAGNPYGTHKKINDNLADVRRLNFQLADDLEMQAMKDAQFFLDKAPKDPGGMSRFGRPTWKPGEAEINKWSNYFRALDPAGVWERTVNGRLTPQEAEAMRTLRPEHFKALQQQIVARLPEIQKNATYDQRTRISILTGVPVDSLMSKHSVDFIQQQYAERAGPDSKPVDFKANALKPEPETATAKLA